MEYEIVVVNLYSAVSIEHKSIFDCLLNGHEKLKVSSIKSALVPMHMVSEAQAQINRAIAASTERSRQPPKYPDHHPHHNHLSRDNETTQPKRCTTRPSYSALSSPSSPSPSPPP